jgi:hypothetical protein
MSALLLLALAIPGAGWMERPSGSTPMSQIDAASRIADALVASYYKTIDTQRHVRFLGRERSVGLK